MMVLKLNPARKSVGAQERNHANVNKGLDAGSNSLTVVLQYTEFRPVSASLRLEGVMRRRAIIACAVLILAGAARWPAQAATEISFGITSGTAFSLAHYIATEKKYYEA